MSNQTEKDVSQQQLFDTQGTRALLDQLLNDSKLYTQSKDYKELLDFVVRLRNLAPFNAMLLQVQKPGLRFAASALDWRERFGRRPKEKARPLLILWPFGPVALVYDEMDTEGKDLPEGVAAFPARGDIDEDRIASFRVRIAKKNIGWCYVDEGDNNAGTIRVVRCAKNQKEATQYQINMNHNHSPAIQFATLAHELGHLFLGHLGLDMKLKITDRRHQDKQQKEIEAESVSYIVCTRNGVISKSQSYLANYVNENATVDNIDVYQVMRAAGQVETLLELNTHANKFSKSEIGRS
ncbi:MAG: ImmA/IrrE family metallo-endopeptidase [Thermodesulfobacteriota bacterium]